MKYADYMDMAIREPYRFGNNYGFSAEDIKQICNDVGISARFNRYLKGKSVIVVGPSPYLKGLKKGSFIDSHDVVIRINKAWKPEQDLVEDYGKKTDVRYHCMMEHENNGGKYDIDGMIDYGVEWLASQFPYNLDYFHNDNARFLDRNNGKIKFHVPKDLTYYVNLQSIMSTRPNVATAVVSELVHYDLDSLHLTGISFFTDGWVGKYKDNATNVDNKGKYMGMNDMIKEGHAQAPQMNLIKILGLLYSKFTMDEEIETIINGELSIQ